MVGEAPRPEARLQEQGQLVSSINLQVVRRQKHPRKIRLSLCIVKNAFFVQAPLPAGMPWLAAATAVRRTHSSHGLLALRPHSKMPGGSGKRELADGDPHM
jgi:hypothetical protein